MKCLGFKIAVILVLLGNFSLYAQYGDHTFGFSLGYNFTTTSKLFLYPNAEDPFLREQFIPIDDITSYSAELRIGITENFAIGLNGEYMNAAVINSRFVVGGPNGSTQVSVKDGFEVYPVELSAYYIMPFSTEQFYFYIGGGLGLYYGKHIRDFGDADVTTIQQDLGYGIQVSTGMDYLVTDFFSVRGELKFRDPQFDMQSKYSKTEVIINGQTYQLSNDIFESKVNINGITFGLGVVLHFL
jgi:hypothetical protein